MQLANSDYANWKAIVTQLVTPATADVIYRVDLAINKVAEAWAVISPAAPMLVYGNFNNSGPSQATLVADFAAAVGITTSINVTET